MENYTRSKVVHVDDTESLNTQPGTIHMKVTNGSKMRNLLGFALKKFKEDEIRQITWNGQGDAISKAISCAEIMKKKIKKLHQTTSIKFVRTEEYWEPKLEGLEKLKVNKDTPVVRVLLSKDELDKEDPSYQPPGATELFFDKSSSKTEQNIQSLQKNTKPFSGSKKSQLAPPSMNRKRKRKGEGHYVKRNDKNDGQSKTSSKREHKNNKEPSKESSKVKCDTTHSTLSRSHHGNTDRGNTEGVNTEKRTENMVTQSKES